MKRLGAVAGSALLLVALTAPAFASALGAGGNGDRETAATGTEGGFDLDGGRRSDGDNGGAGGTGDGGTKAIPVAYPRVQTVYTPACTGNGPGVRDILCGEALNACPTAGDVRFWVYRRTLASATADPPFDRDTDPPHVCRSLEATPLVDPLAVIAGLVDREFQHVVVLRGTAEVSPAPDTLVRIPTIFTTAAPPRYDIPLTLLGRSVVITATAATYTWHFGDGTSGSTSAQGTQGRVEHIYTESSPREAYVVIEWTGTFTVDGGPVQQVNGTATTTGDPVAIEVKQARTELVGSSS